MYKVEWQRKALGKFATLPKKVQVSILGAVDGLEAEPRPRGIEKLHGKLQGFYRLRVGQYRLIYEVDDNLHTVVIENVGHRQGVY